MTTPEVEPQPTLLLGPEAERSSEWLRSIWDHRHVLWVLSRKDFHVRFKRATLGVLWAVAVPLLQAVTLIVVFSRFVRIEGGISYGAFVLSGVLAWAYFASTIPVSATAIVDGAGLTDKVWFPRALLALVPCVSGTAGLSISMVVLLVGAPLLGAPMSPRWLLLAPACVLLVAFTVALSLVLSAAQVYFRDVRFIVNALLAVWIYATPVMYPKSVVGSLGPWLDLNPLTGVISLFHAAVLEQGEPMGRAVAVTIVATIALLAIGIEAQRRHDRVFVDLL